MGELLRSRVRERLEYVGFNPFEAARKAGLERSFLNDLLIGKKKTIREDRLPAVAEVLDCDIGYLTGEQRSPRQSDEAFTGVRMLEIVDICEAGNWRDKDIPPPEFGGIEVPPDPRFASTDQVAFLIRGDHAAGIGITDASVICVVKGEAIGRPFRDGDVVVARRARAGATEYSARLFVESRDGNSLVAMPGRGSIPPIDPDADGVEIVGIILRAIKVFGRFA